MKFGIREICDVVLRARGEMSIGNKTFYKGEPVCYFDTLKSSSMEGASTTVYAQGGRGNSRLASWDGERTVTFTMEDALISPEGLMILTGAGLVDADQNNTIKVHTTERVCLKSENIEEDALTFDLSEKPYYDVSDVRDTSIYVMLLDKNGEPKSEPYLASASGKTVTVKAEASTYGIKAGPNYSLSNVEANSWVLVDYYVERDSKVKQINITPDVWSGYFYLEASTLFRDANTGKDLPAEFIIPKCKVQSNFTFNLSSSGDPSTFTFTMDAFPDYTRFDQSEKVFSAIQVMVDEEDSNEGTKRSSTHHTDKE